MTRRHNIVFLLLISGSALAADPAVVADKANRWRQGHEREILQEF